MKEQIIDTKSGLTLIVIDDLFNFNDRSIMMNQLYEIPYSFRTQWDSQVTEFKSQSVLSNIFNKQDWDYFGMERHPNWKHVQKHLGERKHQRAWCNLHTGREMYRYHADHIEPNAMSMLFYPNMKWDPDWDGQTIFKTPDLKDIEYCSEYVPGRIVLFNSRMPHKAVHPNYESVGFRAIINAVFF